MSTNKIQGNAAGMVVYQMTEAQISELAAQIAERIAAKTAAPQVLPVSEPDPVWISRQDAAARMGISLPSLHGLMNKGAISFRKAGRRTLIDGRDMMAKLASGELAKYKRMQ